MRKWMLASPFPWGSRMALHLVEKGKSSCLNFLAKWHPDNTHIHYLRPRNLSTSNHTDLLLTPPLALTGKKWQLLSPFLYQLELLFVEMCSVRHANFSASLKPNLWTKLELKIFYFETRKSCRNVLCCSLVLSGIAHSRIADYILYKHNLYKCFSIFIAITDICGVAQILFVAGFLWQIWLWDAIPESVSLPWIRIFYCQTLRTASSPSAQAQPRAREGV